MLYRSVALFGEKFLRSTAICLTKRAGGGKIGYQKIGEAPNQTKCLTTVRCDVLKIQVAPTALKNNWFTFGSSPSGSLEIVKFQG